MPLNQMVVICINVQYNDFMDKFLLEAHRGHQKSNKMVKKASKCVRCVELD